VLLAGTAVAVGSALSDGAGPMLPWTPPAATSAELLPFLRNTSRPKLAYSTWYILDSRLHRAIGRCLYTVAVLVVRL
jgi:hypothetical protein